MSFTQYHEIQNLPDDHLLTVLKEIPNDVLISAIGSTPNPELIQRICEVLSVTGAKLFLADLLLHEKLATHHAEYAQEYIVTVCNALIEDGHIQPPTEAQKRILAS